MPRAHLVGLPVHPGSARVEHLHPVDAVVLRARLRILGDDQGQGDVRPGVLRPALDDGQAVEVNILAGEHDFLARRVADGARLIRADVGQPSQRPQLVHQSLGRATQRQVDHGLQAGGQFVGVVHFQGPVHPPLGAEQVHGHGHIVADDVLEEQGRPVGAQRAVGDLGHLQLGTDRSGNAAQVAPDFQESEVLAQILIGHIESAGRQGPGQRGRECPRCLCHTLTPGRQELRICEKQSLQ